LIGVDMTSYYTQQKCTPARASLLTGNLDLWRDNDINIDL
jgi:arylsulfatase A-like enzyme